MTKTLFLTLRIFSATGGIEKVCRVAGKALYEDSLLHPGSLNIFSMYDAPQDANDNRYFPGEIFRGFSLKKGKFILSAVRAGRKADLVILSHINLLVVGWMIKKLSPRTRIVLFAHGIEIWEPLRKMRSNWMKAIDLFLPVSKYTSDKLQEVHGIEGGRRKVVNNCLDPYLPIPEGIVRTLDLRKRYGLTKDNKIILTLSRLSSKERYKGYDDILRAMVPVIKHYPLLRYILAGSYDAEEKAYLDTLVNELGLEEYVIMTGYLPEEELAEHFELADLYAMPSRKEGFGIVFIEAMFYGLPVIAGNQDGSVDALLNGELGLLVDPGSVSEIEKAIMQIFKDSNEIKPDRKLLMQRFGFEAYKEKLIKVLAE